MGHSRIPRCLSDLCTLFVEPKLTSERRPPPWELRDVADKVYNCTKGDNHDTLPCIRGKIRGTHRSVGDGYKEYKAGKETIYVKEYTTKMTWDQAAQQCCSDGARLIKLNSSQRLHAIKRYNTLHWIGLRDMFDNDTFFWTDGSPLRFKAWAPSEPSHLSPANIKENCAEITVWFLSPKWNDYDCNQTNPFLCEKLF